MEKVCAVLVARKEELNELDRGSGDGDCGNTLKAGVDGKREENLATVFWIKMVVDDLFFMLQL